jgi:hypothetical protein
MAITDINISEQLETGAPSIKYTGKEGPRPSMQSQQEMMIAKQVWEAMGDEERGQFSNFQEFFRSGIWKQIIQQAQQDEAQGIQSLGPRNMEQGPRLGAEYGGRIGYADGTEWTADAGRFGEDPAFSKLVEDAIIREENKYLRKGKIPSPFLGEKIRIQMWNDYKTGAMGPAFKAQGGRIGYADGKTFAQKAREWLMRKGYDWLGDMPDEEVLKVYELQRKDGGRIGARLGGDMEMIMRETINTPQGIETLKETENMKMAGPDWYIKRIEHLMYLGYGEDEAAEIAYDSDKYYEAVGHDPGD